MNENKRDRRAPARDVRHAPTGRRIGGRRRREGQSIVEFAIVLPIFMLILCAILDFGVVLYSQMTVINAAREGARLGVVEFSEAVPADFNTVKADIQKRVKDMSGGLDQAKLAITVDCQPGTCVSGDTVLVQVDYNYRMIWPLAFGNTLDLTSTVQMRIE